MPKIESMEYILEYMVKIGLAKNVLKTRKKWEK